MIGQLIPPATLATALGAGITAGILFAFSFFVMEAFAKLPAPQGIAAMQSINVVILNPAFLTVFLGTAVASLLLGGSAVVALDDPGAPWRLLAAVLFLVGVMVVTVAGNIPLNDALAAVDPGSADGARLWERYLTVWTRWNHVRTLSAIASTAAFILALRV